MQAKDALLKIKVVLDLAKSINDNGVVLNTIELQYINRCIQEGLGKHNVKN